MLVHQHNKSFGVCEGGSSSWRVQHKGAQQRACPGAGADQQPAPLSQQPPVRISVPTTTGQTQVPLPPSAVMRKCRHGVKSAATNVLLARTSPPRVLWFVLRFVFGGFTLIYYSSAKTAKTNCYQQHICQRVITSTDNYYSQHRLIRDSRHHTRIGYQS